MMVSALALTRIIIITLLGVALVTRQPPASSAQSPDISLTQPTSPLPQNSQTVQSREGGAGSPAPTLMHVTVSTVTGITQAPQRPDCPEGDGPAVLRSMSCTLTCRGQLSP